MRVAMELDGREASGELQSSPNAIGVCVVRVLGEDYQRHFSRLRPLDDAARKALEHQDRFVSRNPDSVIEGISTPESEQPKEWSIDDISLLRIYVAASLMEAQRRRRGNKGARRHQHLLLANDVIKRWLKRSRMIQTSIEANLSADEARDPIALLRAAKGAIINLARIHYEKTGESAPHEYKRLATVINDYLNHHAKPMEMPDPRKVPS